MKLRRGLAAWFRLGLCWGAYSAPPDPTAGGMGLAASSPTIQPPLSAVQALLPSVAQPPMKNPDGYGRHKIC